MTTSPEAETPSDIFFPESPEAETPSATPASTLDERHYAMVKVLAEGHTQREAAGAAGIDPRTVRTWLQRADVQTALREAEAEYRTAMMRRLRANGDRAMAHLLKVMDDEEAEAAERNRAAGQLLRAWLSQDGTTHLDLQGGLSIRYAVEGVDMGALR